MDACSGKATAKGDNGIWLIAFIQSRTWAVHATPTGEDTNGRQTGVPSMTTALLRDSLHMWHNLAFARANRSVPLGDSMRAKAHI